MVASPVTSRNARNVHYILYHDDDNVVNTEVPIIQPQRVVTKPSADAMSEAHRSPTTCRTMRMTCIRRDAGEARALINS